MKATSNQQTGEDAIDILQNEKVRLRAKQVAVLYDQLQVALAANVAMALILVTLFWTVTPLPVLVTWFSLLVLVTTIRVGLVRQYQRALDCHEHPAYWLNWFIAGTAASGITWGSTTLVLVPNASIEYVGIAVLWICGLSAGSVASLSTVQGAFLAFSVPALIPSTLFLLMTGDRMEVTIGGGLFLFFGFLFFNSHRMHKTLLHGLELQLENSQLIAHLDKEKDHVQKLNEQLEKRVLDRTADLTAANAKLQQEIAERERTEQALRESEERFELAMQGANDGLWDWNLDTNEVYFSPRWKSMLGYEDHEISNHFEEWSKRVHPNDLEQAVADVKANIDCVTPEYVNVHRLQHKDGDYRWILDRGRTIRNDQGKPYRMVGTHVDITEQKQAEDKLRQAATVFENTAEGVMITDAQKRIVAVNPAFTEITGYEQADVLGKPPTVLHSSQHTAEHYESAWNLAQTTGRWQGEIWSQRKSGEVYPQWLTISSIHSNAGDLTNYVGVFADITPIKESQQQLEHIAHHDPLTDLPNRLLLHARLEHAMERAHREKNQLAVLFLDLDRFKNVNDTLGHPAGDRLLQAVAKQLVNCAREDDTVARLGGDEFTILLEGLQEPKDAGAVAYKILQAITKPFKLDGHEVYVTGSVGISLFPDDGQDVTTLLKNADSAMYRAKEQGRNNYQFYTKELTATAFERFALESSLRHALDRGEFTLHYQMQVSLAENRVVGAEALLRWQHPELGLVAPAQFVPLAEETGLIVELGEWVLRTACTQAKAWQNEGLPPLRIAVNVSSVQVTRSQIVDTVAEILEDTGLDPRRLELEITEGLIVGQSAQTIATLDALKAMGVTLALDDFGTGYSSLSYLKSLPLDRLKIDRSFIRDIPHDAGDVAITRAVIALGNNLQLSVIAEGVEKKAQLDILHADRCDEVQGWLYGTPLPATEFAELVRSRIG